MMVVAFEIIIVVVFGIVIAAVFVVVVVTCEGLTLNPAVQIIIIIIDKAKGPIILNRRVMVVAID